MMDPPPGTWYVAAASKLIAATLPANPEPAPIAASEIAGRNAEGKWAARVPLDLHVALMAHIASLRPRPCRSVLMRLALTEYLSSRGLWPPPAPE